MTLPATTEEYTLSSTGLRLRNPEMTYESFEELCRYLGDSYATVRAAKKTLRFAIGDAIIQGELLFRGRAYQAFEHFGLSERSLMECSRVASRVAPSTRRASVSWSHHRAVAPLEPAQQKEILRRVAEEGLSHHALREELRNGAEPRASTVCRCCGRTL